MEERGKVVVGGVSLMGDWVVGDSVRIVKI